MDVFFLSMLGALAAALLILAAAFLLRRRVVDYASDRVLVRLIKERYDQNLWDLAIGMTRVPPHLLMELELRAEAGHGLERPLGTIRHLPAFDGVAFNPAQLMRPPLGPKAAVDLATVLGPRARKPLRLEIPIMISAMAYGIAMSRPFVVALARGAARAGTAYNAGSGPVPEEVLRASRRLIMQYTGGAWSRDPKVLSQADMIEIRYGHGARAALGRAIHAGDLPPDARRMMGLREDEEVVLTAPLPGGATPAELRRLVPELRRLIEGRPVGVKLAATHDVEVELAALLEADVDVIAIDGAQGGTHESPPVIADDFGIPTVYALQRAVRFLERTGARHQVSLVVSGGLRTPGDMLKALALGADAVYLGTAVMMACTHGQLSKTMPFEPITQICWATGARADQFDARLGATTVANFLRACAEEMAEAARALGKERLRDLSRDDLVALDRETAGALGLPPAWRAPGGPLRLRRTLAGRRR